MRRALLISMLVFGLSGCGTNAPYGNYSAAPAGADRSMASDTVAHLVTIYPPALTRWNIMQPTEDAYGKTLVELLRTRGYSVSEYAPDAAKPAEPTAQPASKPGIDLRYLVDSLAPAVDLYRVTVVVGNQPISRAYIPQKNGTVAAAGSWARKE